jgi:hypothetical protein
MKNLIPVLAQSRTIFLTLFFALFCTGITRLAAQCNNDVTLPTPVCVGTLQKDVQLFKPTVVQASEFNGGSTDNCTSPAALQFFIEVGPASPAPPSTTSLSFPANQTGQQAIVLWVVDTAGNADYCTSVLNLTACTVSTPAMVCNDQITVALDQFGAATITPGMMLEGGPYCSDYAYRVRLLPNGVYAPSLTVGPADIGTHVLQVSSFLNGNPFNSCWGNVTITSDCSNDVTPPITVCQEFASLALDTALFDFVLLTAEMVDEGSYDNCTPAGNLMFNIGLNFPGGPFLPTLQFDTFGIYEVYFQVTDEAGNQSFCLTEVEVFYKAAHVIRGTVFHDDNSDCNQQAGSESGMPGWQVRAVAQNNGQVYVANTDSLGHYAISVPTSVANFDVMLDAPFNYGGDSCATTFVATFSLPSQSEAVIIDIAVQLDAECPLLYVDLATPKIRPCFPGTYYVNYTNLSAQTIDDTYIDVTLDLALQFQNSSLPETDLGNQTYRFQTGDLEPGESGTFTISFFTSCETTPGVTHCTEAHIFPDTICPANQQWSGADVAVEAECAGDSIYFSIQNTGAGPNAGLLEYVVVEDVLMRTGSTFQLNPGETMHLDPIPATGATFRLQAEQEPGHPYGGFPAVAVEGCGGFTPGMVTLFPLNPSNPFVAIDCRENIGSFDPNDKQALPRGYGAEHFVEKNTDLDYTIRFQNTGTDTAFLVVLLDTLSDFLAAKQIRPGVSSHPYRFELLDGNIARFVFENIALPDSNANVEASQGFVQFRVPQIPDNPDGTVIENTAAIYFDFNAPVITNTTWHTVGSNFITTSTTYTDPNRSPLRVYPNPARAVVYFAADAMAGEAVNVSVTDAQGRELRKIAAAQMPVSLDCSGLPAGTYFFQIAGASAQLLWSGVLLVK